MSDEDKLETAIRRGHRAEALMADELLTEAFATLRQSYIDAWAMTSPLDVASREKLWHAVNMVGKVREHLAKVAAGGKFAKRDLNMRQSRPR